MKKKKYKNFSDFGNISKSLYDIFDNIEDVIYIVNKKGIFTYMNKYVEEITHYKINEIVGRHFCKFIAPESLKVASEAFRKRIQGKKYEPRELVIFDKTGEKIHFKTSGAPIKRNGKIVSLLGFAVDITQHKKNIEHLSKMVKELSLLYDIGKEFTSIVDIDFLFSKILLYLSATFGYERTGILMIDEMTKELVIRVTTKPLSKKIQETRVKVGQGITGHVAKTGYPYLVNNVEKEPRYVGLDKRTKSEVTVPLKLSKKVIGVINVESYRTNAFDENDVRILTLIANQAAVAIENSTLYKYLEDSYLDTIRALVSAMEAKDPYTRGHSERVRKYAIKIAKELGLSSIEMKELDYAGYLHDIGKIGISDSLLTKVEPLTEVEYEIIKKHPDIGHNILKDVKHLSATCAIIRCEHERFDGNGYPNGLKKDEIPIGARVIAVADAFDAMTTDRPYRKAITKGEAMKVLREETGKQFDPKVVKAFLKILGKE